MPVKKWLNLGCGTNILPKPWVNFDLVKPPGASNFVQGDVRDLPFEKDYADYVILDNVLEHIPMADVVGVLHEVRRVLKPGGRAVIIVPEFGGLARQYLKAEELPGFNPLLYNYFAETIYGNQQHEGEYHKTAFNPKFMNYLLHMVGLHSFKLVMHPTGSPVPRYPGVSYPDNAILRNDILVADITK